MNKERSNVQLQTIIAIVSTVLMAAKFAAYYFTGSVSILTDALESIVNVTAGFIGLYSLHVAAKPKDINHPYGHGKAEFFSYAIDGTVILSGLIFILFYELV